MSQQKKVILLEFNELSPSLLEKFIAEGHLPNFKKLRDQADTYITNAECEDMEYLEPWIQWVTLHTGATYQEHGVYRLGEADKLKQKNIWDTLSEKGKKSWLCGSMNAKWKADDPNVIAIPDPWSMNASASSKKLQPFYDFVRANVQEHTNDGRKNSVISLLAFLKFMLLNGLSLQSIRKICQAIYKTITRADDRWKKATLLDWLQFDVFRSVYKKEAPSFATFFSNSTAHFQHKFWRYMEPEKFTKKPTAKEVELYGNAILFAYKNHDQLIGETFKLADHNTQIILASALSQQSFSDLDAVGGKIFYRPHDIEKIGGVFGLSNIKTVNPVMSHQFQIVFNSESDAKNGQKILAQATLDGEEVFKTKLENDILFCGCAFHQNINASLPILFAGNEIAFSDVFYLADSLKSGKHHPDGVLWVQKEHSNVAKEKIKLTEAHAVIMKELNVS